MISRRLCPGRVPQHVCAAVASRRGKLLACPPYCGRLLVVVIVIVVFVVVIIVVCLVSDGMAASMLGSFMSPSSLSPLIRRRRRRRYPRGLRALGLEEQRRHAARGPRVDDAVRAARAREEGRVKEVPREALPAVACHAAVHHLEQPLRCDSSSAPITSTASTTSTSTSTSTSTDTSTNTSC